MKNKYGFSRYCALLLTGFLLVVTIPAEAGLFQRRSAPPPLGLETTAEAFALLGRAELLIQERRFGRASSLLRRGLKKHAGQSFFIAEATYLLGICYWQRRQYMKAFEQFQSIIDNYPLSERSQEIVEKQYELGTLFYNRRDYDSAQKIFSKMLINAPYNKNADTAQYNYAMSFFQQREFVRAREAFEKIPQQYGFSPLVDSAQFYAALCSYKLSSLIEDYDAERLERAAGDLAYFMRRYPTSPHTVSVQDLLTSVQEKQAKKKLDIANFYTRRRQYSAAQRYYRQVITDFAGTSWAEKAQLKSERIEQKKLSGKTD